MPSFRHFGKHDQKTPQSSVLARPNNAMAVTRLAYTMVGHGLLPPELPTFWQKGRQKVSRPSVSPETGRRKEGRKGSQLDLSPTALPLCLSLQGPLSTAAAARMRGRRRSGARSECGDAKAPTRQKESKKERNYDRERVRASKDKSESVIENFLA